MIVCKQGFLRNLSIQFTTSKRNFATFQNEWVLQINYGYTEKEREKNEAIKKCVQMNILFSELSFFLKLILILNSDFI